MRRPRLIPVSIPALLILALSACQSAPPAATVASAAAPASAQPISIKQQREEAEFLEAIEGLSFDGGVLRIESPTDSPDAARAAALIDAGDRALQGNHRTSAVASYAGAVLAAPDRVESYRRLGRALVAKGRMEHAIATYRAAVRMQPTDLDGRIGLATSLAAAGRRAEAIEAMEAALRLDPDSGIAHERLAVWRYYDGEFDAARQHVRAAEAAGTPVPPQLIDLLKNAR